MLSSPIQLIVFTVAIIYIRLIWYKQHRAQHTLQNETNKQAHELVKINKLYIHIVAVPTFHN